MYCCAQGSGCVDMKQIRSITYCAAALRRGEVSAVELTDACIATIRQKNPQLGAFLFVDEEHARAQAAQIDRNIRDGKELPILAGIPIAVKDNICTRGTVTTCASRMLKGFVPPYDAAVIERLCQNGAVIVGKTNLDEFAMGATGENSAYGLVRNPQAMDRVAGGSSSGSAAAVAAGMVLAALGSDTGGSIRQPAAHCGVVGFKPSYGAVSRFGLIAFASSMDQIGPMANSVQDVSLVFHAICGRDGRDSTSQCLPAYKKERDFDFNGVRIALPVEYLENTQVQIRRRIYKIADILSGKGAVVKEVKLPMTEYLLSIYYLISSAEASSNLARFDGIKYGHATRIGTQSIEKMMSLSRSEGFGDEVKRRILLGVFCLSAGYYEKYYQKACVARKLVADEFAKLIRECPLILMPVTCTTAPKIGAFSHCPEKIYSQDFHTVSANIAGLPALSLPAGKGQDGLPIGAGLMAGRFQDHFLLSAAAALERVMREEGMTEESGDRYEI